MKTADEPRHITIKKLMIEKNIRQRQLSKRFRVHHSTISRTLNGERKALLEKIYNYVSAA